MTITSETSEFGAHRLLAALEAPNQADSHHDGDLQGSMEPTRAGRTGLEGLSSGTLAIDPAGWDQGPIAGRTHLPT
jgi:hypothetical protein